MSDVEAKISGITGTLHTTEGDYDMGAPTRVAIDGRCATYTFVRRSSGFVGVVEAFTLWIGGLAIRRPAGPIALDSGADVTVEQVVMMEV